MKKLTYFFAGIITAAVLISLSISALASDGALTITTHPINVLVNGEVFQPKDANGNDVLVFTYNGTTYAPLRALAEAYGLEVGYDGTRNIATVNKPAESQPEQQPSTDSYTYFADQWSVTEKPVTNYGNEKIFTVRYSGNLTLSEFKAWWKSMDNEFIKSSAERIAAEAQSLAPDYTVTAYFTYDSYNLGTAYAFGGYEGSNFAPASIWIK